MINIKEINKKPVIPLHGLKVLWPTEREMDKVQPEHQLNPFQSAIVCLSFEMFQCVKA